MPNTFNPVHPGLYVKENYIQKQKLTVTKAAELIGLSRPSLSNFLNGKVSATTEMATRLERAFGIPSQVILELQAKFDAHASDKIGVVQKVGTYAPPFLNIQANQIEYWFTNNNIHARTQLAVLLRTLVHSIGHDLQKVDFPGNDDAQRAGWDGWIEAGAGTPWIPLGISGWEFGVNSDIKGKADGDFEKSVKATAKTERDNITFIFVTPRRWSGKTKWIAEMKAKCLWKDVRAYDSSDLEQWMEQSLTAQAWFANQSGGISQGVKTLDQCWQDWANATDPCLPPYLFDSVKDVWKDRIKSFLENKNPKPLVITADSVEEALAFLSQVLSIPEFERDKDRVLVFNQVGVLPKLIQGATDFIAVAHTREVEKEFGSISKKLKTIVIYPRNATSEKAEIILEPLGFDAFSKALELMGKTRDDITSLSAATGRSLTVLRRRLSNIPIIRTPEWATNPINVSGLIPFVLIGAWNAQNEADRRVLSLVAGGVEFETLDKRLIELLQINDSPIWSIGGYSGVISKIDSLFAIAKVITKYDLKHFYDVAKTVLGEDDPSLDLPEADRWAASIHGKKREFSSSVREGISETLVLLSVHGKNLFGERLGFDGEKEAEKLISDLLEPINIRTLEANQNDLPLYAEAAPNKFLTIIERDLREPEPELLKLLRPANVAFGFSCPRTGLLWALEALAWNISTFPRVVRILAQFSQVEINDNWANKPINSLGAIFRAWMPQTAVNHEIRLKAMCMLLNDYPKVGWIICIEQFGDHGNSIGSHSSKPKWRTDGYGYGEPFKTWGPINAFVGEMVELALTREFYTTEMICDLISRLHALNNDDQNRVWEIIKKWSNSAVLDEDIARVRERIRTNVLSRRGKKKADSEDQVTLNRKAREIYEMLVPKDIVSRYDWLFKQAWVDFSADELEGDLDFEARSKHIEKLRKDALKHIVSEFGVRGIFNLAEKGFAQYQIGMCAVSNVLDDQQIEDMILLIIQSDQKNSKAESVLCGALLKLTVAEWEKIYLKLRAKMSEKNALYFLSLSPYRALTWQYVDQLSDEAMADYWDKIVPQYVYDAVDENNESIRRLLAVKRPRAAFNSVHFDLGKIQPFLLIQMLKGVLEGSNERSGEYQLDEYYIKEAFKLLVDNQDITLEEKAVLEFGYLDILGRLHRSETESQIPNLECYIEENPNVYVQAIAWTYRRKDSGDDPEEYKITNKPEDWAHRGYRLLEALSNIPGQRLKTKDAQREKLSEWISTVRKLCTELSRLDVGDMCLGKLLSHASVGDDGIWPNEVVRDVIEEIMSENIADGARTGIYNSRGVHTRSEGGSQERELADKYRSWADALQFTHPFVANNLLMSIARIYESEAQQNDLEAVVMRRLRH